MSVIDSKSGDAEIAGLVERYGHDPEAILTILQGLQAEHGGITAAQIQDIAGALDVPVKRVNGVATFYSMLSVPPRPRSTIRVCDGVACWLKGSQRLHVELRQSAGTNWHVARTSCLGLCDLAPAALVDREQCGPVQGASVLLERTSLRTRPNPYVTPRPGEKRVLLKDAGQIDPDSLESALQFGAYQGLRNALAQAPGAVVAAVAAAGLSGRGGAGFPTGKKWELVAQEQVAQKYIVCNADESEPLIFKDRVLIDTNPHQILEGMAIAGYAVGASEGCIYIRGEYAPQAERLDRAIQQARAAGWLGERIQESEFSFDIHVHRGAGAYICGEETALLESLEGKRGEPRQRPPYPIARGFRGRPTVVNNVETLASVPAIALNGAKWYRSLGDQTATGTKLYLLLGHVRMPGLFEARLGLTLRQIIDDFGGGMPPGSTFNFALTGGAAGTIVPPTHLDIPINPGSWAKGVSLGAGGFLICDQTVSPVHFLRELVHFFESESCGKCTPCRLGTHEARLILDRLAKGHGRDGDTRLLVELASVLQTASFCGLGQSVATPMKSAIAHFSGAFETRANAGDQR